MPCSQPTWVPVSSRFSRRKSTRSLRGSQRPSRGAPLTVRRTSGTRRLSRAPERPLGEDADEVAAIVGGGVEVGVRLDQLAGPAPPTPHAALPPPLPPQHLLPAPHP